jgi:hypothetical protein
MPKQGKKNARERGTDKETTQQLPLALPNGGG